MNFIIKIMIGINNVTILGNIGTISDVMSTSNGGKFLNITIATTEAFLNTNKEKITNTQWHNIVLWNNMCDLEKSIEKGDLVYVEGRLNYRKKSSNIMFTEIVAKNFRILNKKNYDRNEKKDYFNEDNYDFL
jgi:single-strand DNA-binding protein